MTHVCAVAGKYSKYSPPPAADTEGSQRRSSKGEWDDEGGMGKALKYAGCAGNLNAAHEKALSIAEAMEALTAETTRFSEAQTAMCRLASFMQRALEVTADLMS